MAEMVSWLVSSTILLLVLFVFYGLCAILDRVMKSRSAPFEEMSRWNCKDVGLPHIPEFTSPRSQERFCRVCGAKLPPEKIRIFYPD